MNRYQDISFRTVEELLLFLPDEQRKITEILRRLVQECMPDAEEKLSYNVPFYSRYARICFIWPGAVPWGKKEKDGVELGFCRGDLLPDSSYLQRGSRKQVSIKTFYHPREIDAELVRQLLYEAIVADEAAAPPGKKRKGRMPGSY